MGKKGILPPCPHLNTLIPLKVVWKQQYSTGKKTPAPSTSSGKADNLKKTCGIGQSSVEGAEGRFLHRLWGTWGHHRPTKYLNCYEGYRHLPSPGHKKNGLSHLTRSSTQAGKLMSILTQILFSHPPPGPAHIRDGAEDSQDAKIFPWCPEGSKSWKQDHMERLPKDLNFMLDSLPTSWRRNHELNFYADLKH